MKNNIKVIMPNMPEIIVAVDSIIQFFVDNKKNNPPHKKPENYHKSKSKREELLYHINSP